jgi:hypothetical protein
MRGAIVVILSIALSGCSKTTVTAVPTVKPGFEVVPIGMLYKINVPTDKLVRQNACPTCDPPRGMFDFLPTNKMVLQRTREFCAELHKAPVVMGGGFDMGTGDTTFFRCDDAPQGGPKP